MSFPVDQGTALDPSSFVTVVRGELPLVLSVPHGGMAKPKSVPDRSSNRNIKCDLYTIELAQQLSDCIAKYCGGKRPFLVINKLHRIKVDANRHLEEEGQGRSEFATALYKLYHTELQSCCEEASLYGNNDETKMTLLLDIHGYTLPDKDLNLDTCWVMLGHKVSSSVLKRFSDEDLGPEASWIRGPRSLGSLLEKRGLNAEPSSRQPFPSHPKYFTGGYITEHYRQHGKVKTIQLEFPSQMRTNLDYVVPRVGQAIVDFMQIWLIYSSQVSNM